MDDAAVAAPTTPTAPTRGKPAGVKPRPQLTKAERRELQEKQKAAKAAGAGNAGGSGHKSSPSTSQPDGGVGKKGRQSLEPKPLAKARAAAQAAASTRDAASIASAEQDNVLRDLRIFSHFLTSSGSKQSAAASKVEIHPAIQRLALQFSEFRIVGGNARCVATANALKEVIRDYHTPAHSSLSRHIMTHISPQINHLVQARPLATSMSNLIRKLKEEVTSITEMEGDVPERDAKQILYEQLDHFVQTRILFADSVITETAIEKIQDGSVILTYAKSSVVEQILLTAHHHGKDFSVHIVDSGPLFEGKRLLYSLSSAGINCTYSLISALSAVIQSVDLVLLGTHTLYANGALYSRAGTALVAMVGRHRSIPVLACCETYKFHNGVPFDGFGKNELASHLPSDNQANLQTLRPLYDLTPATSISAVVTEFGLIPPSSVPTVLARAGVLDD